MESMKRKLASPVIAWDHGLLIFFMLSNDGLVEKGGVDTVDSIILILPWGNYANTDTTRCVGFTKTDWSVEKLL